MPDIPDTIGLPVAIPVIHIGKVINVAIFDHFSILGKYFFNNLFKAYKINKLLKKYFPKIDLRYHLYHFGLLSDF